MATRPGIGFLQERRVRAVPADPYSAWSGYLYLSVSAPRRALRAVTYLSTRSPSGRELLASPQAEPSGDRASRTSGSGARTVDLLLACGEHLDVGDRSGRQAAHRRHPYARTD